MPLIERRPPAAVSTSGRLRAERQRRRIRHRAGCVPRVNGGASGVDRRGVSPLSPVRLATRAPLGSLVMGYAVSAFGVRGAVLVPVLGVAITTTLVLATHRVWQLRSRGK